MGALLGISGTGLLTATFVGADGHVPVIVAPMAASSVILFALPASPLARPRAIVVGNVVSALVGVTVARYVPNLIVASGLAVGLAIWVMAQTRSLHPPGGATALVAVLGGPSVTAAGYGFAWLPIGCNALLLTGLGMAYHRWVTGHRYPYTPAPATDALAEVRDVFPEIRPEDIDAAVAQVGEVLDVDRETVERLVREVERAAARRRDTPIGP